MQRYHAEKHIIDSRVKKYKQIAGWLDPSDTRFLPAVGRFRKTLRCSGCRQSRCYVCHSDKFPRRIPTAKEQQAQYDWRDYE
jgi:hypothetical protein